MRILSGRDEEEARHFMEEAVKIAGDSPCFKSQCGSVIVSIERLLDKVTTRHHLM